ncbi:quinoprotein relay system zinc metallohydrolase 2 [Sedimentitalea sp. JM2-8]|uniref:Quinoprotein relay system zinc metallohydrolase 2 n=1 Tax=Sedimentitalea xiamensis TaxID=3050037 RepID=A0ABT7FJL0_9RHOB|nr:quinoprotein relay system zinc metallohydrolase 2 [Sedimentitalea xiamensis]MDK3075324.1 quinoprotein relay system zinc metallohydrolase 2 [Sedimentitalea xiamensis]
MFELIVTLCLLSAPETCRDVLLPGFERASAAACADAFARRPVDVAALFPDSHVQGEPRCQPSGPAAEVQDLSNGVFVFKGAIDEATPQNLGGVSNAGFVVGGDSVAVIDSGGSRRMGEELWRSVRAKTDLPVSHVILTHMHPDHVLGTSVFAEAGARVVGHEKLGPALADRRDSYMAGFGRLIGDAQFIGTKIVLPDLPVPGRLEIDLGGRVLDLRSWPTAHTGNDLTVLDPAGGVLFTGDLVFDDHAPALDGSVRGWISVLSEMKMLEIGRIVPGHGGPVLNWPSGAQDLDRYLEVLAADTRAAIGRGDPLSTAASNIAASEAENWQLFDLFNARNATVAYTELEWE